MTALPPPLEIGPVRVDPPIFLAPMAGLTDAPMRRAVRRFGVGLTASEMVASGELLRESAEALGRADLSGDDAPIAVQIAGRDPGLMAEAARRAEGAGAALIDINMGCPCKRVVGGLAGAGLLCDLDHALRIIEAVVSAVALPVTVKTRLGWDAATPTAPELARRAEGAGARLLTLHARRRDQYYKGASDWVAARATVQATRLPVVINGDIVCAETARRALQLSGAAGVMIGRGAQGAPWRLAEIAAGLGGRAFAPPSPEERLEILLEQYDAMLLMYGQDVGLRAARKHLGWALAEAPRGEPLRRRLMTLDDSVAVTRLLKAEFIAAFAPAERRAA